MPVKRSDGRWMERFTLDGKRYTVYGRSKKEVLENVNKKMTEVQNKSFTRTSELSLDEYHSRWEEARIGTVKDATIRKQSFEYANASKIVIDDKGTTFGSIKVTDISAQDVRILQRRLRDEKRKDGSPKYKSSTLNGIMNHVKHVMNDAVRERIITWNPFCAVKNLKRTEEEARNNIHRALTREETKDFFTEAESSWYYNSFRFAISTGCRCGEIGALKNSDIDFKKGVIKIRRTITKDLYGRFVIGTNTKTSHGQRDIPLTDALEEIIHQQRKINSQVWNVQEIDPLIFKSPENTLLEDTCVNREIARVCNRAGIKRFTAHCFRDTFATRCIESGMKPKTLQEILGHADIGITMNLYCHVMEETKVKEMEMVDVAL